MQTAPWSNAFALQATKDVKQQADQLEAEKQQMTAATISGDDLLYLNVAGHHISVKRSTLTQARLIFCCHSLLLHLTQPCELMCCCTFEFSSGDKMTSHNCAADSANCKVSTASALSLCTVARPVYLTCSAHVRAKTSEVLPCSLQKQLDLSYTLMLVHVQLLQSLCESSLLQHMLEKTLNMFWPPASAEYDIASRSDHNVEWQMLYARADNTYCESRVCSKQCL